jgi:hypothetical protein
MNTAKATEDYVMSHPSVKDCLAKNLINYSKLARIIANELKIDKKSSFEAILIACRRLQEKMKKEKLLESGIMDVLKKSKLELKNKVIAVVLAKGTHYESLIELQKIIKKKSEIFHIIEGANAITIVTNEEFLSNIKEMFRKEILVANKDLVEITIKSPIELETTPGVMGYLYSLFSEHGINIVETMSCYTDTLFVIEEKDVPAAMQALKF